MVMDDPLSAKVLQIKMWPKVEWRILQRLEYGRLLRLIALIGHRGLEAFPLFGIVLKVTRHNSLQIRLSTGPQSAHCIS